MEQSAGSPGRWKWPGTDKDASANELVQGAELFGKHCAICHGVWGAGDGPLASELAVRPRDFRRGVFKYQSTYYGAKPLSSDLEQTIAHGLAGTTMPPFNALGSSSIVRLARHVLWLARRGEVERELVLAAQVGETLDSQLLEAVEVAVQSAWDEAPEQLVSVAMPHPGPTADSIARGRAAFTSRGCVKCHGPDGRGETEENLRGGLRDYWGEPVRAADLTSGRLKGGQRPEDVYRRIMGGINGTPMPSFRATLASEPGTVWDLVDFVLDLPSTRGHP
ncbi:MAG: c-type cytochrome [Planctomycetaceae bacterium]